MGESKFEHKFSDSKVRTLHQAILRLDCLLLKLVCLYAETLAWGKLSSQ